MSALLLLAIAFFLSALSFMGLNWIRRERRQIVLLLVSFFYIAFMCLAAVCLAFLAHRDFLSVPFMSFLGLFSAIFSNKSFLRRYRQWQGSFLTLRLVGTILLMAVFTWLIVVSYSLVTRTEPRLIESFIYNVYNAALAMHLAQSFLRSTKLEPRRLRVSYDRVGFDDVDLTSLFSKRDLAVLNLMVEASDRPVTCKSINLAEHESCRSCAADSKASSCLKYKRTQESIAAIDKLFRTFKWGRVVGPTNKQEVLSLGWRLSMAPSVHIQREADIELSPS